MGSGSGSAIAHQESETLHLMDWSLPLHPRKCRIREAWNQTVGHGD